MDLLLTGILFVIVTVAVSAAGVRLWARPKAAMERVTGTVVDAERSVPVHPSLVFRDLIRRLGTLLPASTREAGLAQRQMIRAGFRNPGAVKILYGAKIFLGAVLPLTAGLAVAGWEGPSDTKMIVVGGAAVAGFMAPGYYVKLAVKRRQKRIRRGLPDALDLLVICVESGLGLDQAILQGAKELEIAHPAISEEFALVNLELKAGKRRAEALRNLADRTSVDELKKLVAVLIQADRFGTSISQSLRTHSDFMRVQARQQAEEKAAKLGVKLVFPIFFCILPTLFVVTVGPVAVRIVRDLLPMMNNM
jgi:tight adherence protein C